MRSLLFGLLLCCSACGGASSSGSSTRDPSLPPECPQGFESPVYCFSGSLGTATSCGACATVGESCDYFEASLVCACDHQWRCSYAGGSSGGCQSPDGGIVCN